jgi:methionyl-tRNA formyltransferase
MRIVYFGSDEFAIPVLRSLVNSKHDISAIVVQSIRSASPGDTASNPLAVQAEQENLQVIGCDDIQRSDFLEKLSSYQADMGIISTFRQLLPDPVRAVFKGECIGIHPSLLPKFRGPDPVAWSILSGESKSGISVYRLMDIPCGGPILVQRETAIRPGETTEELNFRLARIACDAIGVALELLESDPEVEGEPQDDRRATTTSRLKESDGYLFFEETAEDIARRCRAMWPWPGGRCRYRGSGDQDEEMIIISASATTVADEERSPGMISSDFTLATHEGALEIHGLKLSDDRLIRWRDFIEERNVKPGDRFDSMG